MNKHEWGWFRIARLGIGLTMLVIAIYKHEAIPGLLGAIFVYQAILNTGCASGNCQVNYNDLKQQTKETTYEEIK